MKEGCDRRPADASIVDYMSGALDAESRNAVAARLVADAEARTILAMAAMASSAAAGSRDRIGVRPAIARTNTHATHGAARRTSR